MYPHAACRIALGVLLLTAPTPMIAAQELASSLDQLRVLVKPGDTVSVTDGAGQETRGTITALSSTSLELVVAGSRRTLLESDISAIRQRRSDVGAGASLSF